MTAIYGLFLLASALALGLAIAGRCGDDPARRIGAGLLAAAHAPLLLATLAMAVAVVLPGQIAAIRWLPVAGALVPALVALCLQPRIAREAAPRSWRRPTLVALLVLCGGTLAVLAKLLAILVSNLFPIIANDALTYLAEARMFAAQGSLAALAHGLGDPASGAPPTHPHTALFAVYLGHSLLFSPGPQPAGAALGDDMPVRLAFQFTVLCLAMAVVGMTMLLAAGRRHAIAAGAFALMIFCAFQAFEYTSFNSSRDPFRLIPWLGLLTLLIVFVDRRGLPPSLLPAVATTAGWLAASHTINLYFLAVVAPIFVVATLLRRVPVVQVLLIALAGLVGLALPVLHYVDNLRRIGNVLGNGMNYFHYPGTALAEAFLRYGNWSARDLSPLGALQKMLEQQGMMIGLAALAGTVVLLAIAWLGPRERRTVPVVLAAAFLFLLAIPLIELKRLFPIDMKEAMVSNYRYAYTVFILSPVIMALSVQGILAEVEQRFGAWAASIFLVVGAVATALFARAELHRWRIYPTWDVPTAYRAKFEPICEAARALPVGSVWLSDRSTVSYQCGIWPVFLYSPAGRRYFLPTTVEEARKVLEGDKVGLVSLEEAIPGWWPETAFYKALTQLKDEGVFDLRRDGGWQIFTRRPAKAAGEILPFQARANARS
ncbi:hypothetical protein QO058_11210 [Bosea vestrisii]|uniref:hypothetical protein n=1 Tax=Bosea vestrisii TaxID=151416 RepID=UPI0024DFAA93|nr:hypothetical protein [Bosea vestrisii]WID98757.1 hypothetical protein QO058_11210 [Bosea vestrisii]